MGPPAIPKFPDITARFFRVDAEVGGFEKSSCTEEDRFNIIALFAQKSKG
jgi:hypothetical protein